MIWFIVALGLTFFAFAALTEKGGFGLAMCFAFGLAAYFCYREAFREYRHSRKRR